MRNIEKEMMQAIHDGRNWQSGNTSVVYHRDDVNAGVCSVFLHGNRIAIYDRVLNKAFPDREMFYNFPTATTRSRLRALGINASIRNGEAYVDDLPC